MRYMSVISGEFVKVAFADQIDILLQQQSPGRPAARFNRCGEDALYLSVDEQSARVAMRKYAGDQDPPRVLIRYNVEPCHLLDLRHVDNKSLKALTRQDWQAALSKGQEPTSWQVTDQLRRDRVAGLIDPSRNDPQLWHVTLLRWNMSGAPRVTMLADPTPIVL